MDHQQPDAPATTQRQPPMGQPGQGELDKPELLPLKEGEQRPD